MNKIIILTFFLTSFSFGGSEKETYLIDLTKSKLRWVAKKLTGSHWGNIRLKSGIVKINNNLPIAGEFIVDMKTIEVMDTKGSIWGKKLQSHLHSKDFFDTENYPEAKLSIKKATMRNGRFIIDADLSIKSMKCSNSKFDDNPEIKAYVQVKDLTNKKKDNVFVFNGWMFSSSPSIKPFDHAVYDIWLIGCI